MTRADLEAAFAHHRRHFSPFFVLGDPTPELSVELARAAVAAGATMLELGIPYRDPCADGPAIQRACARAFAAGSTTERALATLAAIDAACPGVPKNLLVYGNLAHARGLSRFCRELAAAGASSLLVPDIPLGEDAALLAACAAADLGHVRLVGPRSNAERIAASAAGCALLYVAGVQGVTGTPQTLRSERAALLARVAAAAPGVPLCAGFGIGSRADVEHALAGGAAIAVVGSRLAEVIAEHAPTAAAGSDPRALTAAVAAAVRALLPQPPVRDPSPVTGA
ncbi:MAG: tryptophan synthase subunit alpha [Planctomycetes bacterium]|nr:tryptophan synthase subunit alpha [Planctomycetota bacterium]